MVNLRELLTKEEFIKFENTFKLKEFYEPKIYLRPGFFKKDLYKLKSCLSKYKFKIFIGLLKLKNIEFEYKKS